MKKRAGIIAVVALLLAACSQGDGTDQTAASGSEGGPAGAPKSTPERPIVVIETDSGSIVTEWYPDTAPVTCDSLLSLVHQKFYDSLTFHRIVPGFVIQGGCPLGNGTGDAGFKLPAEFSSRPHVEGTLSMARGQHSIHSAGCQFFICLDSIPHLDSQYTVFGSVIEGMEVVRKLATVPTGQANRPLEPVYILRMYENL